MNYRIFVLSMIVLSFILLSCDDKTTNPDTDKSRVTIGTQVWTSKNLDVDHYRNGDEIPQVSDIHKWVKLTTGAWCYYNNDVNNDATYGKLYNWYAVNDPRGLAPEGWHVASDEEWTALCEYLGGGYAAGGKLKSTGTIEAGDGLWYSPNEGATNKTGFSALPGGVRGGGGMFICFGGSGYWWSSTKFNPSNAWSRSLDCTISYLYRPMSEKEMGFSVRCVKD